MFSDTSIWTLSKPNGIDSPVVDVVDMNLFHGWWNWSEEPSVWYSDNPSVPFGMYVNTASAMWCRLTGAALIVTKDIGEIICRLTGGRMRHVRIDGAYHYPITPGIVAYVREKECTSRFSDLRELVECIAERHRVPTPDWDLVRLIEPSYTDLGVDDSDLVELARSERYRVDAPSVPIRLNREAVLSAGIVLDGAIIVRGDVMKHLLPVIKRPFVWVGRVIGDRIELV